jgi:hypothetical protein
MKRVGRSALLLIAVLTLAACDPPYQYVPDPRVPQEVFPGVVITPNDTVAIIGSHHFTAALEVKSRSDEPVVLARATAIGVRDAATSWDRVHLEYRTAPPRADHTISTTWFWDAAAVQFLGRRPEVRFELQNGERRATMVVRYRRTR